MIHGVTSFLDGVGYGSIKSIQLHCKMFRNRQAMGEGLKQVNSVEKKVNNF